MTFIRDRRVIAAIVAASSLAVPASAAADQLPSSYKSDAAQSGTVARAPYSPAGFQGGDSAQAESTAATAFPPAVFRGGDTPVAHPGASRAPAAPTPVEVVRPERTIVRDVDESLPLILSSAALLLALAGAGVAVMRTRMTPRPGH